MIGTSGRIALALGNSSSPLIPGMLMSDRIRMRDRSPASTDALKSHGSWLCELHRVTAGAQIAPELLAEQHLDIGLVIDYQDEHIHTFTLGLLTDIPRGSTIRNSVNAPGLVLTSIDPLCCLTMMS